MNLSTVRKNLSFLIFDTKIQFLSWCWCTLRYSLGCFISSVTQLNVTPLNVLTSMACYLTKYIWLQKTPLIRFSARLSICVADESGLSVLFIECADELLSHDLANVMDADMPESPGRMWQLTTWLHLDLFSSQAIWWVCFLQFVFHLLCYSQEVGQVHDHKNPSDFCRFNVKNRAVTLILNFLFKLK